MELRHVRYIQDDQHLVHLDVSMILRYLLDGNPAVIDVYAWTEDVDSLESG